MSGVVLLPLSQIPWDPTLAEKYLTEELQLQASSVPSSDMKHQQKRMNVHAFPWPGETSSQGVPLQFRQCVLPLHVRQPPSQHQVLIYSLLISSPRSRIGIISGIDGFNA